MRLQRAIGSGLRSSVLCHRNSFLEVVAGQDQIRIWDSPEKQHPLLEPWADTSNLALPNPRMFWPLGSGFNAGMLPPAVYLEGVKESQISGQIQLKAGYLPPYGGESVETDRLFVSVVNVEMHMDEDRSGSLTFYQPGDDTPTGEARYIFWLNNDFDWMHHEEGEWHEDDEDNSGTGRKNTDDNYIGNKDGVDANSACKRDLEDFAMLQLRVPTWLKDRQNVTYTLQFRNGATGNPEINLFEAHHKSSMYLKDATIADKQILKTKLNPTPISTADGFDIPRNLVDKDGQIAPFIFEGVSEGTGELVLTVKLDDIVVAESLVSLELHDVSWFYDEYSVKSAGIRYEAIMDMQAELVPHGQDSYTPTTNEYLLFVHGWNMLGEWEKERWAETIFKRLWWLGYQGGVGLFSWQGEPPVSGTLEILADPENFDNSEFKAWLASAALANKLKDLKAKGLKLGVLAHSQGNVVAGEALKKYDGPQIDAYIASQAAISASVYDHELPSKAHLSSNFFFNYPKTMVSLPLPLSLSLWAQGGLTTPDIYGYFSHGQLPDQPYFSGNRSRVKEGRMFNFYNEVDYALTGLRWELNNALKPTNLHPYRYNYEGRAESYEEPFDRFYTSRQSEPLSVAQENSRYQIFAYCAQSHTKALGTQAVVEGFKNINLRSEPYNFTKQHYSHSRQFRSNLVDENPYWRMLFLSTGFVSTLEDGVSQ